MQTKFKIIIPSYNNEKWVEANVASILNQTYTNYDVLYINDASTDNTLSLVQRFVGHLPNWTIVSLCNNSDENIEQGKMPNIIQSFLNNINDILVFVDGDDWLYDESVLAKLNEFYNNGNFWMTYGGMVCYPGGEVGYPQNTPYDDVVHKQKLYRRDYWRASHLRTFKWGLYKRINQQALMYSKTEDFYFHAEDLATSYPCLEMCPQERVGVLDFYSYVFNAAPINRERGIVRETEAGVELELEIRSAKQYKQISSLDE